MNSLNDLILFLKPLILLWVEQSNWIHRIFSLYTVTDHHIVFLVPDSCTLSDGKKW